MELHIHLAWWGGGGAVRTADPKAAEAGCSGGTGENSGCVEEERGRWRRKKGIRLDEFGMLSFAVAVFLGLLIAKVDIPLPGGGHFSLGTSGGPLLAGLIMGNLSHIGSVSQEVSKTTLENLREIGLALFLMGAGTNAGKGFVEVLMQYGAALFILGGVMMIFPMALGYMLSRKIFSIDVLNTLGSICGGMTSTPALGTLITMTRSEAVAVSYAATYPVALIMVVLSCEFLPILCG